MEECTRRAWFSRGGLLVTLGLGGLIVASGIPVEEVPVSLGVLAFGLPYFSLPVASVTVLQQIDPWLVFLLVAIVWLGDSAAYYVGSSIGRNKLAPRISPNKSWEGSIAGFLAAIVATIVWSWIRQPDFAFELVLVGAVTAFAAQLGDLLESLLKRSVRIKDSGNLLPGHGGVLDRMDALMLSAPTFLTGIWLVELPGVVL